MKKGMKALSLILCMGMVVVVTVMGTLAYLTDRESVTNTFTVGNVDITVDEAKVTPEGVEVPNAERVNGNEYHLIPGKTYVKDPTMTVVKGSEESYVRMFVTITCYDELKAIFGAGFLPQGYASGWDSTAWPCVGITENNDNTVTYEFRYYTTVKPTATEDLKMQPLFTSFTLPGFINGEQLATIKNLKITVEGHAIQAATFATANDAWAAFDSQMNP